MYPLATTTDVVARFITVFTQVMTLLIVIRAILSWFPVDPANALVQLLNQLTEPILAPLRAVLPRFGMIDLSPLVAIVLLQVIGAAAGGGRLY